MAPAPSPTFSGLDPGITMLFLLQRVLCKIDVAPNIPINQELSAQPVDNSHFVALQPRERGALQ